MNIPQVSVILPTHNRHPTLARALDSVLAQTWCDLELIVVDDGSTDGTDALLSSYGDSRLHVIRKAQCQGAARARNDGIRAARAEWIAFQDSDDIWLPDKLKQQLELRDACGPETGWIGGAYCVNGEVVSSPRLVAGDGYDEDLLAGAPFVTPTWLVRRDCLLSAGLFDESMPCLEDWDLIFRLADRCHFRAVPEVILERHGSVDSLFGDLAKRRTGLQVILTQHRERWLRDPARYASWCAELGRLYGLAAEAASAHEWLKRALELDALRPRTLLLYLASFFPAALLQRLSRSRLAPSVGI